MELTVNDEKSEHLIVSRSNKNYVIIKMKYIISIYKIKYKYIIIYLERYLELYLEGHTLKKIIIIKISKIDYNLEKWRQNRGIVEIQLVNKRYNGLEKVLK